MLGFNLVSGLAVRLAFASLMLGFNLVSGLAVRLAFASLMLGSNLVSGSVSTPPSEVPVYQPVPTSCSARLLFISFMVRISKFRLIRLVPSVRFSSIPFDLSRLSA